METIILIKLFLEIYHEPHEQRTNEEKRIYYFIFIT
jgi:hypothetical protein